ncbi:hypothetical protein [Providencia alcalifaciens]|uniref:hypothetical protein n=1 Tax=Providencia alcalifaciens TaxID=126385 RepID=UPI0003E257B2|nr:hypothetical protein [Providencia alcalifaciens]ETT00788.1 hypothetical protein HMPREF1568_1203 [Providencia alcalifaciens PAL-3]EUD00277.1 hypothetical protein HMPREF1566_2020 [Providencia alcalifaciens PAL-1]
MSKPIPLDRAVYKAQQNNSLLAVILEQVSSDYSRELIDLVSIAYDFNAEICESLEEATK